MKTTSKKNILIVDDEDTNIYALKSYLEMLEHVNIIVAKNGAEAISMIHGGVHADVILLDMMMPVMDGYETLKAFQENENLRQIPVIAVTAKAMKGDREKCIEAGAWDYISKPLDMKLLVEKINQLIAHYGV